MKSKTKIFLEILTGLLIFSQIFLFARFAFAQDDSDKDGLVNDWERIYGANPNNPDTDGDGFLDGDEVLNGYDPARAGSSLGNFPWVKQGAKWNYLVSRIVRGQAFKTGDVLSDAILSFNGTNYQMQRFLPDSSNGDYRANYKVSGENVFLESSRTAYTVSGQGSVINDELFKDAVFVPLHPSLGNSWSFSGTGIQTIQVSGNPMMRSFAISGTGSVVDQGLTDTYLGKIPTYTLSFVYTKKFESVWPDAILPNLPDVEIPVAGAEETIEYKFSYNKSIGIVGGYYSDSSSEYEYALLNFSPLVPSSAVLPANNTLNNTTNNTANNTIANNAVGNTVNGADSEDLKLFFDKAKKFLNSDKVQDASKYVALPILSVLAIGNFITGIATSTAAALNLLPYLRFLAQLFTEPMRALAGRPRRAWGTVYDSLTKMPIDLATVRLFSENGSKLLETSVTDTKGRFRLAEREGVKTFIEAAKMGYEFPSKILVGKEKDYTYSNLYFGGVISPKGKETGIVLASIPLDSIKKILPNSKILKEKTIRAINNTVAVFGIFFATLNLIVTPAWYTVLLLAVHIALYIIFCNINKAMKVKPWGRVYESGLNTPVKSAVIRIFDAKWNRLLETMVADTKGRYGFLVGGNNYYLTSEKLGYSFPSKTDTKGYHGEEIDFTKFEEGAVTVPIPMDKKAKGKESAK